MSGGVYVDHAHRHRPGGSDPLLLAGAQFDIKLAEDDATFVVEDGTFSFAIPADLNEHKLVGAAAYVTTAGSGATTIQIHNVDQGVDMLSTRIGIDAGELRSYGPDVPTAAAVIDPANADVAAGDILRIDIDANGGGTAMGLGVILSFDTEPSGFGGTGAQGEPGPAGPAGAAGANATISTVEDEGSALTARASLNFVGAGVTAADVGGKTVVTIPGGGGNYQTVEDEGSAQTARSTLNFVGAGVTVTDAGGKTVVTIPGGGGGGSGGGVQIDYAETTAVLTITATTDATAQAYVTGNAVTYDGATAIVIEGYIPMTSQTAVTVANLYDGSTDLGRVLQWNGSFNAPGYFRRVLTPSAGSHTYSIRFWKTSGTSSATAGAGGTAAYVPGFIRITATSAIGASGGGGGGGATELDYVQATSNVAVASSTSASPTTIITAGAVTYDGATTALVEFFAPMVDIDTDGDVYLHLYDGSTDLGRIGEVITQASGSTTGYVGAPVRAARRITPSAGSHTFSIRAHKGTGNASVYAGAGGSDTAFLPMFLRQTVAASAAASSGGGTVRYLNKPAGNITRTGTTVGAFSTAWQITGVVVASGQNVLLRVSCNSIHSQANVDHILAIKRGTTQICARLFAGVTSSNHQGREITWVDENPGAGTYTYEIQCAAFGSGTVTVYQSNITTDVAGGSAIFTAEVYTP